MSCLCLVGEPLVLRNLASLPPPLNHLMDMVSNLTESCNLFTVKLKGKTVSFDIEVVDVPLDYNLLLGCSLFYEMTAIASSMFRIL